MSVALQCAAPMTRRLNLAQLGGNFGDSTPQKFQTAVERDQQFRQPIMLCLDLGRMKTTGVDHLLGSSLKLEHVFKAGLRRAKGHFVRSLGETTYRELSQQRRNVMSIVVWILEGKTDSISKIILGVNVEVGRERTGKFQEVQSLAEGCKTHFQWRAGLLPALLTNLPPNSKRRTTNCRDGSEGLDPTSPFPFVEFVVNAACNQCRSERREERSHRLCFDHLISERKQMLWEEA